MKQKNRMAMSGRPAMLSVALMAVLLPVALTGCNLEPGAGPGGGTFNPVGTWVTSDPINGPMTLTARANGTFTLIAHWWGDTFNGTYTVSGNNIMFTVPGVGTGTGTIRDSNSVYAVFPAMGWGGIFVRS